MVIIESRQSMLAFHGFPDDLHSGRSKNLQPKISLNPIASSVASPISEALGNSIKLNRLSSVHVFCCARKKIHSFVCVLERTLYVYTKLTNTMLPLARRHLTVVLVSIFTS